MKKSKKKIAGIVLIVFGATSFLTFDLQAIASGLIFVGIGVLLVVLDNKKKKAQQKPVEPAIQQEPPKPPQKSKREIARENAQTFDFSVAGVTFNNDDGTSRQAILKKILDEKEPFEYGADYILDSYEYNGEDAVRVLANDEYMIGNVPKDKVDFVLSLAGKITDMEVTVYDFESDEGKTIYAADVTVFYKDVVY